MFKKSRDIRIKGGNFTVITRKKGRDPWRKNIAPGAFHNSRERLEFDPPKCHPQTRVAVIQAIIDWIEDRQKTTFITWLNGPAGAGKSAIAQEIAELCYESGCLVASFFWSRSATGRNNAERLIATLAYQLLTAIPQLRQLVEQAVANDTYIFSRSLAAQMETLIIQPLKKAFESKRKGRADSESPKVIILDGLDECATQEAQQSILKVIADSVQKFSVPICFIIASRPEKAIRDSFNDKPLFTITSRVVLDDRYHPDDDIRLFLVESFESVKRTHELRSLLPRAWPTDDEIDQLVRKSSGQFIYAATVMKFVRSSRGRPKDQLDIILGITAAADAAPFAELDALYCRIFSLVLKDDCPRALEILSVAFLVDTYGEHLTARRIETMLSYRRGELQLILTDLHSVLHVPVLKDEDDEDQFDEDNKLRVLHASLQDFLMNPSRSKEFYIDEEKAHARIAQHFLRYIREYSPGKEDVYSCDEMVFCGLERHCYNSTATKELLLDCFDFDPEKWASRLITGFFFFEKGMDWDEAVSSYLDMAELHIWFQEQEAKVQEYFRPASLTTHLSRSWKIAIDSMCGELCCYLGTSTDQLGSRP
ncbi:hypothetical protein M413DRAFT_448655 [Hebeloma cylindrosporum]|uniref:Nephrocystin 3-like N-terminal domain-containing protein n=1 Tax=Hebeloma cylindrosporum TaxID=76867 RepID=A0A0C2Y812_HEBCY|nr:hypothetical protein M413DRAFT_448655 [Hebeloma cylindrosporum h7]